MNWRMSHVSAGVFRYMTAHKVSMLRSWKSKEAAHDSRSLYPGFSGFNFLLSLYLPLRAASLSVRQRPLFWAGL